jgi:hypothetical protein
MPTTIGLEFTKIFNWDGGGTTSAHYTDVTLEAQSPAGTAFTILNTTSHYLYLGHDERFDMAIFDMEVEGGIGALTWEYHNGTTWIEFIPGSGRYQLDPDDSFGSQFDFSQDGAEIFPHNVVAGWATAAVNSVTKYWIRVTTASVETAPTIKRIQMRPLAAYATTKDVFELLQMGPILTGTDFTSSTTPSKSTVEAFIEEAQSWIDFKTRKSWRPTYVANEYHEFNLNGMHLDHADPYKILKLEIWNGGGWDNKRQGRKLDFFLVPDTGLIHYSRYFLLPARFQSYNAPIWRWGGGEFTMPIKVTYLTGRDIALDTRGGGIVHEAAKKMAAINIMRGADFGNLVVSGMDRVQTSERIQGWQMEIEDAIESLWSFEIF